MAGNTNTAGQKFREVRGIFNDVALPFDETEEGEIRKRGLDPEIIKNLDPNSDYASRYWKEKIKIDLRVG